VGRFQHLCQSRMKPSLCLVSVPKEQTPGRWVPISRCASPRQSASRSRLVWPGDVRFQVTLLLVFISAQGN